MLRNYLKIAFRTLQRQKTYAFINIGGLAVGLAACLVIGLYLRHELSYDEFHEKADRIYRVVSERSFSDAYEGSALTPQLLASALEAHLPAVAQATRLEKSYHKRLVSVGGRAFYEEGFFFADSSFFEMFSFSFLRGNPETALDAPGSIVLTQSMAEKYFPGENPLGQTLRYENEETYTVTGVIEDVPSNSHVQFDFLARLEPEHNRWFMYTSYTYVVLHPGTSPAQVNRQLDRLVEETINPQMSMGSFAGLHLQPITRIHLYSHLKDEITPNSDVRYLYIFSAVVLLILLMACINYMNLSTARAMRRAKEVGIRKTAGATRFQLMRQFLGESTLLSLAALGLALVLAELALPVLNHVAGTTLSLGDAGIGLLLAGGLVVVLAVGLVAGSYPALYLSQFHPAQTLRGTQTVGPSGAVLRKGLIVTQFTVTIALLVATGIIFQQLTYLRSKRLGFDKENVVIVSDWGRVLDGSYDSFKRELLRNPHVLSVAAGPPPDEDGGYFMVFPDEETGEEQRLRIVGVDFGYAKTLDLTFIKGRPFSRDRQSDSTMAFVANERAVQLLGWEEPVGKAFDKFWQGGGPVVGVVENFHMRSLHQPLQPMLLMLEPGHHPTILVRLAAGGIKAGLEALHATWNRFVPGRPLLYSFLDDQLAAQYKTEQRLAQIFGVFAGLAILVACLGLFGLAAFIAERRTKEIGIRKVLGASVPSIVALLSKDFLKLVLVAFVVAAPVAYWAMSRWLQDFAYHIDLGIGVFLLAGALALLIALATVSYQAIKAALADPVEALRYE